NVVAALRPHLVAGEPCPVCEQAVTTLPAPLPAEEVDAARARRAAADRAGTAAQSAARTAAAAAAKADADLAAGDARWGDSRFRRRARSPRLTAAPAPAMLAGPLRMTRRWPARCPRSRAGGGPGGRRSRPPSAPPRRRGRRGRGT